MWEQVLPWIGGIFAGLGVIFLFFDIINSIRKRNRRALNIAGLVVLSIGVVGYVITDIILQDSAWPPFASLVWLACFWAYVVLVAIEAVGDIKIHKRKKRTAATKAKESQNQDSNPTEQKTAQKQRKQRKQSKKQ